MLLTGSPVAALPALPTPPSSPVLASLAKTKPNGPSSPQRHTSSPDLERCNDPEINPLFSIGEQIERGEIEETHIVEAREGSVIFRTEVEIRKGDQHRLSLLHRNTKKEDPGMIRDLESMEREKREMVGEAQAQIEAEAERERGNVRARAHASNGNGINGKGKGRSGKDNSLESGGGGGGMSPVEEGVVDGPGSERASTSFDSSSYFSSASNHHGHSTLSTSSTSTPLPNPISVITGSAPTSTSALSASPTSLHHPTSNGLPPPPSLSVSPSPHSSPSSISSAPATSRHLTGGSSMRRSQTAGTGIASVSSSPPHSPSPTFRSNSLPKVIRTRSTPSVTTTNQHHPSLSESSPPGDLSFFAPGAGAIAGPSSAPMDDVEISIAAQAELIRKERLSKRMEQEALQAQARVRELEGSGAPVMMKRRSTRMGSSDMGLGTSQGNVGGGHAAGVLVGNLIGQDHANYVLMYNMLTGIRIGVSRCQAKLKRPLTDADYTARHKFSFDIVGNELTPSSKYDFKFKDYAPWVFRELREYFYLDPSDYLVSLTAKYILSELGSPGKSGSFFYFSRDYRFIIKTIKHSEHKFLRNILKEYHEYVTKNPHTLLSRFYGLHRVKLPRGKKIHFVIMNNLFPPHRDIHETYDLKGSAIGRYYPEEKAALNPRAILKDLNWVTRKRQLALGPEKKALFEEQLRRDTALMQKLGIMDYSLLTGIHIGVRGNADGLRDGMLTVFQPDTVRVRRKPTQVKRDADAMALRKAVQRSDPKALSDTIKLPDHDHSERRLFLFYQDEGGIRATGDNNEDLGVIYYLGVIDILTPYTCIKKVENFFKGLKHDRHMISAVPPHEYGERFLAFIYSSIVGNDESKRPRMFERRNSEKALEKGKGKEKGTEVEKEAEKEADKEAEKQQRPKAE